MDSLRFDLPPNFSNLDLNSDTRRVLADDDDDDDDVDLEEDEASETVGSDT